jgi:hypothetical protein
MHHSDQVIDLRAMSRNVGWKPESVVRLFHADVFLSIDLLGDFKHFNDERILPLFKKAQFFSQILTLRN